MEPPYLAVERAEQRQRLRWLLIGGGTLVVLTVVIVVLIVRDDHDASGADWLEAIGTCVGALITAAALYFAFGGWRASTRVLELEELRFADDRAEAERRALLMASGVEFRRAVERSGYSISTLSVFNVSGEPFEELEIVVEPAKSEPYTKPRILPGESWSMTIDGEITWAELSYRDTRGYIWFRSSEGELPELRRC